MPATSSYKTFLMLGTTSGSNTTYSKLVDIKSSPDLGGSPELLDTTTLSDGMETHIFGIQKNDQMDFTANYSKTDFNTVKALEGTEQDLAVWFGGTESGGTVTPTGSDGKFSFKGFISVHVNGTDVNAVREMTISVAASSVVSVE